MKRQIFFFLSLAIVVALTSCSADSSAENDSSTATITGTIDDTSRQAVSLWRVERVGDDIRVDVDSSETPSFSLTAEVPHPGLYRLQYGRNRISVFLHPGDDLQFESSAEDMMGTALFTGKGAKANNYLADSERKVMAFAEVQEEKNPYKLDEEEFIQRINEQRDIRSELYTRRFAEEVPSIEFEYFARGEIEGEWANQVNNYPTYHGFYSGIDNFEVSDGYPVATEVMAFDDKDALISPAYRALLYGRSQRGLSDMVSADTTLAEDWPYAFRVYYDTIKADDHLGVETREFILASHLNDYISIFGVDGIDEIWEDFSTSYASSDYMPSLQEKFDSWSKLAKGQPAPGFTYRSIDGEEVSLSDFEGNVVYVDVWATWCGPCKREIPASKELKKKMEGKDVVFLYVSVDENQESWEDYLENDPEFKGVHLITGTGWKSDITDEYMIDGIPRYLLIDREGNIATASAPRPSSGEKIENLINETLAAD